jgi:hypothetical protein
VKYIRIEVSIMKMLPDNVNGRCFAIVSYEVTEENEISRTEKVQLIKVDDEELQPNTF